MRLNYRKYYYGAKYVEKSIEIPDNSRIFNLEGAPIRYKVKDVAGEVFSSRYLILCDTIEEDFDLFYYYYIFGDKIVIITDNIYIAESENLNNFPTEVFKDYVITLSTNKEIDGIYKITGICADGFITDRIYLINPYTLDKSISIDEDYILSYNKCYGRRNVTLNKDIYTFNSILTNIYNRIINK